MARPEQHEDLHVLMTADAVGGVWQYALDLSGGLQQHGVRTTIAVLGPAPSADQQEAARAAGAELIATGLPLDWMAETPHEVEEAGLAIARLAAALRADVVHLNTPALAANAVFDQPVVAVCHSCVATWWQSVRGGALPDAFVWRTQLVAEGYAAASRLLAPTRAFAQATAEAYNLDNIPSVVTNGRQSAPVGEGSDRQEFFFTAGRLWDDGKNFAALDRVAARLSAPLLAAGPLEGPNGARVEAAHAQALGRLSDAEIARHLSAQPIFVSLAMYEPFGLAVLEAAQMGCALVLSDIPTFRELWDGAAVFVDPADEAAVAGMLESLLQNTPVRAAMGRSARERAGCYTVASMSAGVFDAYRSVLSPQDLSITVKGAAA